MNLYGLIGYPLGHSFSKKYFTDKFANEGIKDSFFELFPIEDICYFPQLIKSESALKGLAVTIPYKQDVMPYLQSVNEHAMEVGAVNCIRVLPTEMIGYNTDIIGFEKSFAPLLLPHHKKALVLGTGGASKAVQYVLNKLLIPFLIVSRTPSGTEISYSEINNSLLKEYTILVNCSPVGMEPNEDFMPSLPYHFITSKHFLYDLVYQPAKTKFLNLGELNGALIKNGYEMLIIQAEENWKIWTGTTV
ncbi:MAG: shikimate dehydrogenase [Ferruginibacter sp.]